MTAGNRIPIEPLSNAARSRIRERVVGELQADRYRPSRAQVRPAPKRWPLAALGVGAMALASLSLFIALRGQEPASAPKTTRVYTTDAPSTLQHGGATVTVGVASAVVLSGDADSGVDVILETGDVHCQVEPRGERPPFRVHAGAVLVEVVGTEFSVRRRGADVTVTVDHGTVRVTKDGQATLVRGAERWPVRVASVESEGEGESESGEADEALEFEVHRVGRAPRVERKRKMETPVAQDKPALSDRELFNQAAASEAGDAEKALRLYQDLEKRGGPWAANALFARGRLELDRGNKRAAKRLLTGYLRRYPRGANAGVAARLLRTLP